MKVNDFGQYELAGLKVFQGVQDQIRCHSGRPATKYNLR